MLKGREQTRLFLPLALDDRATLSAGDAAQLQNFATGAPRAPEEQYLDRRFFSMLYIIPCSEGGEGKFQ
jgi:hypothetical protein